VGNTQLLQLSECETAVLIFLIFLPAVF